MFGCHGDFTVIYVGIVVHMLSCALGHMHYSVVIGTELGTDAAVW